MNRQKKCCDEFSVNADEHLRIQAELREKDQKPVGVSFCYSRGGKLINSKERTAKSDCPLFFGSRAKADCRFV